MGRKVMKEERREQILEALSRCLLKKPFKETSIKDIAREAGVNHGVLHYYFSGKEDILLTFMDHIIARYKADYIRWMEAKTTKETLPGEVLDEMFAFAIKKITLNRKLAALFVEIWEISLYNRKIRSKLQSVYREWIEELNRSLIGMIADKKRARSMSVATIAFLEGVSLFAVTLDRKEYPVEKILGEFRIHIRGMIDGEKKSAKPSVQHGKNQIRQG